MGRKIGNNGNIKNSAFTEQHIFGIRAVKR